DDAGGGLRFGSAVKTQADDAIARAALHKICLELKLAGGRTDACPDAVVRHGEYPRAHAECRSRFSNDLAQLRSLAQTLGAIHVGGKVAVAKLEPRVCAEAAERFETAEAIAAKAPSTLGIGQAGQCVHDSIEVRRDVQTLDIGVVCGISNEEYAFRLQHAAETTEKTGCTDAAGQRDHG